MSEKKLKKTDFRIHVWIVTEHNQRRLTSVTVDSTGYILLPRLWTLHSTGPYRMEQSAICSAWQHLLTLNTAENVSFWTFVNIIWHHCYILDILEPPTNVTTYYVCSTWEVVCGWSAFQSINMNVHIAQYQDVLIHRSKKGANVPPTPICRRGASRASSNTHVLS